MRRESGSGGRGIGTTRGAPPKNQEPIGPSFPGPLGELWSLKQPAQIHRFSTRHRPRDPVSPHVRRPESRCRFVPKRRRRPRRRNPRTRAEAHAATVGSLTHPEVRGIWGRFPHSSSSRARLRLLIRLLLSRITDSRRVPELTLSAEPEPIAVVPKKVSRGSKTAISPSLTRHDGDP